MSSLPNILLLVGTVCAAAGQIALKLGATGRVGLMEFLNPWIVGGLFLYGLGTVLWIWCLSRLNLTVVYPFTALTFVLVYLAGAIALKEPVTTGAIIGVALIMGGLFLVTYFGRGHV
jgi:drug/metabolite transporter (DMT)-like permease